MQLIVTLLTGIAAGTHTSIWGMYSDSPFEGFTARRFGRSIWRCGLLVFVIAWLAPVKLPSAGGIIVLFGATYTADRIVAEWLKTFLREEDQGKYAIPMQLHVLGRVVQNKTTRVVVGLLYLGLLAAVVLLIWRVGANGGGDTIPLGHLLVVGSAGGLISAVGGAWKDAPIEGFSFLKFPRSPVVSLVFAVPIATLTADYVSVFLASTGYSIAAIETYKVFIRRQRRGKFAGKPIAFPDMLTRRRMAVPVFITIWLGVIGVGALALLAR